MEINTQNMEALLRLQEQQAAFPRNNSGMGTGFENILNQQMRQLDPSIPENIVTGASQNDALNRIMFGETQPDEAVDADTAVFQAAFEQASGTLDMWDNYARVLGGSTSTSSLRDAWGMLQGIDESVAQLRSNPALAGNPELNSILNELEIMTAAEKFKFNRGDYIS